MLVIGLTGGIGTGKSEVARILQQLGAVVIDADKVGHEVYAPHSEGWREVVRVFGPGVLTADGEVDRRRLGSIVFADAEKLAELNAIAHPAIREHICGRIQQLRREEVRVVVVEAALLRELQLVEVVDEVWVTHTSKEKALKRAVDRSGLPGAEVMRRMECQQPFAEAREAADVVIHNDGSIEELEEKVRSLWGLRVEGRISHQ